MPILTVAAAAVGVHEDRARPRLTREPFAAPAMIPTVGAAAFGVQEAHALAAFTREMFPTVGR